MTRLTNERRGYVEEMAYQIRKRALELIANAGWGHIGGSFSMADMIALLYFHVLRVDPQQPDWESRDLFVLSKAHASPALYAALALKGFIPMEKLYRYCRADGLDGHTDMRETPGIEATMGSLGTGLSYAAGIAMSLKLKERYYQRAYCLIGDGEANEGQIWEAAMSAAHYRLDNLIVVVDYNKVMAKGFVHALMGIEPFADKWRSFGFEVMEADGHDLDELDYALYKAKYLGATGKPACIIAHTVKGKGVEECEFNYNWHTHAPSRDKANFFLRELAKTYGRTETEFDMLSENLDIGELIDVIGGDGHEV